MAFSPETYALLKAQGGGGGGSSVSGLVILDNNELDKSYNDIVEIFNNGVVPFYLSDEFSQEGSDNKTAFLCAGYSVDDLGEDGILYSVGFRSLGGYDANYISDTPTGLLVLD